MPRKPEEIIKEEKIIGLIDDALKILDTACIEAGSSWNKNDRHDKRYLIVLEAWTAIDSAIGKLKRISRCA